MTMPCMNCDAKETIKAHLIPKVFCREVHVGKSHAANVEYDGTFKISQSGLWDDSILCSNCDNRLGELEDYAYNILKTIRSQGKGTRLYEYGSVDADCKKILRCFAGILFKYSITQHNTYKIDLNRYQQVCQKIAFSTGEIPCDFNAALFRLTRFDGDEGVFAYRVPIPDRKKGVNVVRLLIGGVLIFIKVDRRKLDDPLINPLWLRGSKSAKYILVPAQEFEEYRDLKTLVDGNEKLSEYLEKQERTGCE